MEKPDLGMILRIAEITGDVANAVQKPPKSEEIP